VPNGISLVACCAVFDGFSLVSDSIWRVVLCWMALV